MKNPARFKIERAKRTLIGRIFCRLLGDQTGAVLMEYVVLGVLLVAAVVGAVMMFGDSIKDAFDTMSTTIFSPKKGKEKHDKSIENINNTYRPAADDVSEGMTDRKE